MNPVDELAELFDSEGAAGYLGEVVTQAQHMLQAGSRAEAAGASDALVAAALLHDVGHFRGTVTGEDLMKGIDNRHDEVGAAWLAQWFPPAVTEPVRLHVAAKRYLCIDPEYAAALSPASVYTFSLQGGPMDADTAKAFESDPHHHDALVLRRWDDQAKDKDASTPPFAHFRALLEGLVRRA